MKLRGLANSQVPQLLSHQPKCEEMTLESPDFEAAIAFAQDLIRIPGLPGAEGGVARRVLEELRKLRFHDAWTDEAGNVIGVIRGHGGGPSVMLNCHLDSVDPGDPDQWEHHPYQAVLERGFLHGRGSLDIKGPLALQTHAAARFVDERPAGDVIVAHTVLEERGGWGMDHLMSRGEVRPDAIIIGEVTGGDICIGHRGRAEIIVEIHGEAAHASMPDRGLNPLCTLSAVLPALQDYAARLPAHPVLGKSTLVPTSIACSPSSPNVIPDRVTLILDWRTLPDSCTDRFPATLQRYFDQVLNLSGDYRINVRFSTVSQTTYTGLSQERRLLTPSFLLGERHPMVLAAVDAVRSSTGVEPRVRHWEFASDGGHSCGKYGVPTVGFAPGDEGLIHTNRERLDLQEARIAFHAYSRIINAVQSALG